MHYYFLYCINWRMGFGVRIYVASIKVDSVGVNPIGTSGNTIRVEDRKKIEDKLIPQ